MAEAEVSPAQVGDTVTIHGVSMPVGPSCGANRGAWHCLTHPGEALANQLQKDTHIYAGRHVLAWLCVDHGPEVP